MMQSVAAVFLAVLFCLPLPVECSASSAGSSTDGSTSSSRPNTTPWGTRRGKKWSSSGLQGYDHSDQEEDVVDVAVAIPVRRNKKKKVSLDQGEGSEREKKPATAAIHYLENHPYASGLFTTEHEY